MRLSLASLLLLSAVVILPACKPKQEEPAPVPQATTPTTEDEKTFYALGALVSKNLEAFQLTEKELDMVKLGLSDGVAGKTPQVDLEKYRAQVQKMHETRMASVGQKEAEAGKAFLEKAAGEPGAVKTASGLVIKELKPGTGASPKATDQVKVHYHGTLTNGEVFDSSVQRNEPATFPLNRVIACWTEGLQLMKVGGKSRLICPANIAYGDQGSPPQIKPGATLIFDVELLDIVK